MSEHDIVIDVNGESRAGRCESRTTLSDFLRDGLGLTGTHVACEHGVCGACTVLVDGDAVRSCLLFAAQVDGRSVVTIEGIGGAPGALGSVQQAFMECHGLQCGFCTPGFVIAAEAFLAEQPQPTDAQIVEAISANLCRCTGYQGIAAAVRRAVELRAATEARS